MMRFDTHANRVRYGVSIFVTYTPNEAQNMVMLRVSRTRRNDPVFAEGHDAPGQSLCGRRQPPLGRELDDEAVFGVSVDALSQSLPSHDQRRAILSRDPLASADGFRVLCAVTTEHLFGVRNCPDCPHCNNHQGLTPLPGRVRKQCHRRRRNHRASRCRLHIHRGTEVQGLSARARAVLGAVFSSAHASVRGAPPSER